MTLKKTVEDKGEVDMIGQLLAKRYQILRVLGAGAFGQTYVAQDTHIPGNPTCVVKHLKPASNSPKLLETARELFQREAETLVKLGKHEQIPQLMAYFEEDQEFYLVQEFIEGHTLTKELLPGQQLPESQVKQLLVEVLEILEFVHSQGVIHRDIKPDNIMRRHKDDKLVLIDFGAIKQVQTPSLSMVGQEQSVATSTRIGTPGYAPTEQERGKPRPSSDIYALGIVAIQALTGLYPHQILEDDETGELIWQHLAQVSPRLAAILTKMVRYHFKDRYQSAAEALQALQQLQHPSSPLDKTVVDRVTHYEHEPFPDAQAARQNTTSNSSRNRRLQQVSTPTTRFSSSSDSALPLLIKVGVAMLLSVAGGYAYLHWQSSNPVPTEISTAKSGSTASSNSTDISTDESGKAGTAITKSDRTARATTKSSGTGTSTPNSDSTASFSEYEPILLANATEKASSGDLKGAIALASQISPSSSVYQQAQNAIAQWQRQQQQKLAQQSERQARRRLAHTTEVPKRRRDTETETASNQPEEAIAKSPPNTTPPIEDKTPIEDKSAIAQLPKEATTKQEPVAVKSSYTCSCQPDDLKAQKAVTDKESGRDLTGSSCSANEDPEAKVIGVWKCNKK
ncbi:serine/threonine-protein kinase [Allocoleopsis sp.]|uniref:serine/threonine-protein kinase n=1 Tax=Allocoleopsis sp. TaxID=3088169 RepID=UPI002FD1EF8B